MTTYYEGKSLASDTEPVGLLTEGAAGIAVIVLAVVSLAGVSAASLTSIAAIVIGVGLMAQGFNSAADNSRMTIAAGAAASPDLAGEVMVDVLAGITGVILGILALIGINVEILLASALIVFGGSLMLSGALTMQERVVIPAAGVGGAPLVANRGSAAGGMEVLLGIAAIVLGILALVLTNGGVLVMVGYIAVGAALLLVSASFTGAVIGIFTSRSTTTA